MKITMLFNNRTTRLLLYTVGLHLIEVVDEVLDKPQMYTRKPIIWLLIQNLFDLNSNQKVSLLFR